MSVFSAKFFSKTLPFQLIIAAIASIGGAPAFAADLDNMQPPAPAAAAPVHKSVCSSFLVRASAKTRFAVQMRAVPPQRRLTIKSFSNVQELQYIRGAETYDIDRHYCAADVAMSDGRTYPATYVVARNQGFAAIGGLHISFCVAGLDDWLVRDNECRSLRAPNHSVY